MSEEKLWFLFHNGWLVVSANYEGVRSIPKGVEPPAPPSGLVHEIGSFQGIPCVACEVEEPPQAEGITIVGLRASYDIFGEEIHTLAGKGWEMIYWDRHSRFCPGCGQPTELSAPNSKFCPVCEEKLFPHLSVAILALVRKDDSILLVRAHAFTSSHFGLVAGFLEPGESLEECVAREVMEETGLSIKNVSYFGSQPWPYPSGLMVGFIADYEEGKLKLQEEELSDGKFYTADSLPTLPHKLSLARRMIDWWLEQQKSN